MLFGGSRSYALGGGIGCVSLVVFSSLGGKYFVFGIIFLPGCWSFGALLFKLVSMCLLYCWLFIFNEVTIQKQSHQLES